MGFLDRVRNAWNVFKNRDPTWSVGSGSGLRPDRMRFSRGNERSIITSVFNKIAIDVASVPIHHVKVDDQDRFSEVVKDDLDSVLNFSANIDQSGRDFIQDAVQSMFDEGAVALVPVDTDDEPHGPGTFDILSIRTARIDEWFPEHVRVNIYNDQTGRHEDKIVEKRNIAIVNNPMFTVMNEPSSTMQRLARKLALMDVVDEQASSGRLDMIIQLPYVIKTEARRTQAELRRQDIAKQLAQGPYGIAYTDGTEKVIQLNRPVENNLMKQIEYHTNLLFSQIGVTQAIMDGSAEPKVLQNYYVRIVEPILSAFVDEMKRKFLTKTAITQGHSLMFFRDPFKLIPSSELADIADKMVRNQIMSPNEMRQKIGLKPSTDPRADELRNPNISEPAGEAKEEYEKYEEPMAASAIKPVGGCGKPLPGDKPTDSPLPRFSRADSPSGNNKKKGGIKTPRGPTGFTR